MPLQIAILGGDWDRAGAPMRTCLSARARGTGWWGVAEGLGPERLQCMKMAMMTTQANRGLDDTDRATPEIYRAPIQIESWVSSLSDSEGA